MRRFTPAVVAGERVRKLGAHPAPQGVGRGGVGVVVEGVEHQVGEGGAGQVLWVRHRRREDEAPRLHTSRRGLAHDLAAWDAAFALSGDFLTGTEVT